MKHVPGRDEQFARIARLKADYQASANPIISMDTKKKEYLGNFYREGRLYTTAALRTFDHDFNSFAQGIVIPHGIYDLKQNTGYMTLGTSHDTSAFACDHLRTWWADHGHAAYPAATSILLLCDGGGSNSSGQYAFKEDLQHVADAIGVEIRVAHYPPYASKYNPIEHRLFPHVTRACQGVIFKSTELVRTLMANTTTATGLRVIVNIMDTIYQTGRQVTEAFKQHMPLVFDDVLPRWNYRAIPNIEII